MALRVLLADESSTIKKVFQLALQDYAVDVKSVNVGTDVLSIASEFQPDIIFADVLLQKQNGYDVSVQLKNNTQFAQTPIILMWSGFMDFDEDRFNQSQANDRLEKPFDVDTLRGLIQRHVPKTQSQILSKYLTFPQMPEMNEEPANSQPSVPPVIEMATPAINEDSDAEISIEEDISDLQSSPNDFSQNSWDENSFEPISTSETESEFTNPNQPSAEDEFQQVSIHQMDTSSSANESKPLSSALQEDNQWVSQDLSEFQLGTELDLEDQPPVNYQVPQHNITPEQDDLEVEEFSIEKQLEDDLLPLKGDSSSQQQASVLDTQMIEKIIAEQAREVIEKVVWQVVPEIAKRVIEKELTKLLEDENELR